MTVYPVSDLVGLPFKLGGRGPAEYDCYGLVTELYKRHRDIILPDFKRSAHQTRNALTMRENAHLWRPCEDVPGVLVFMRTRGSAVGSHVGWIFKHNWMIHCWEEGRQVMCERLDRDWRPYILGFYDFVR